MSDSLVPISIHTFILIIFPCVYFDRFVSAENWGIWWDMEKVVNGTGQLTAKVNSEGTKGDISVTGRIEDKEDVEVFLTHDTVTWSSVSDDWLNAGTLEVNSALKYTVYDAAWNATGYFNYGNHAYMMFATDTNYFFWIFRNKTF